MLLTFSPLRFAAKGTKPATPKPSAAAKPASKPGRPKGAGKPAAPEKPSGSEKPASGKAADGAKQSGEAKKAESRTRGAGTNAPGIPRTIDENKEAQMESREVIRASRLPRLGHIQSPFAVEIKEFVEGKSGKDIATMLDPLLFSYLQCRADVAEADRIGLEASSRAELLKKADAKRKAKEPENTAPKAAPRQSVMTRPAPTYREMPDYLLKKRLMDAFATRIKEFDQLLRQRFSVMPDPQKLRNREQTLVTKKIAQGDEMRVATDLYHTMRMLNEGSLYRYALSNSLLNAFSILTEVIQLQQSKTDVTLDYVEKGLQQEIIQELAELTASHAAPKEEKQAVVREVLAALAPPKANLAEAIGGGDDDEGAGTTSASSETETPAEA